MYGRQVSESSLLHDDQLERRKPTRRSSLFSNSSSSYSKYEYEEDMRNDVDDSFNDEFSRQNELLFQESSPVSKCALRKSELSSKNTFFGEEGKDSFVVTKSSSFGGNSSYNKKENKSLFKKEKKEGPPSSLLNYKTKKCTRVPSHRRGLFDEDDEGEEEENGHIPLGQSLKDKVHALQGELNVMQQILSEQEKKQKLCISQYEMEIQENINTIALLEQEREKYDSERLTLLSKLRETEDVVKKKDRKIKKLIEQLENYARIQEVLTKSKQDLHTQVQDMMEQNEKLVRNINEEREKVNALDKKGVIEGYQTQLRQVLDKLVASEQEREQLHMQLEEVLKSDVTHKKGLISRIKGQLSTKSSEHGGEKKKNRMRSSSDQRKYQDVGLRNGRSSLDDDMEVVPNEVVMSPPVEKFGDEEKPVKCDNTSANPFFQSTLGKLFRKNSNSDSKPKGTRSNNGIMEEVVVSCEEEEEEEEEEEKEEKEKDQDEDEDKDEEEIAKSDSFLNNRSTTTNNNNNNNNNNNSNNNGPEEMQEKQEEMVEEKYDETKDSFDSGVVKEEMKSEPPQDIPVSEHVSRMNEYVEARSLERQEHQRRIEERNKADKKWKEAYRKEWETLAEEEKRRKAQLRQQRTRRRPGSMKSIRTSHRRHQIQRHRDEKHQKTNDLSEGPMMDPPSPSPDFTTFSNSIPVTSTVPIHRGPTSSVDVAFSSEDSDWNYDNLSDGEEPPPLPPEPSEAEQDLIKRQQARIQEMHIFEEKRRLDSEEAAMKSGEVANRVKIWSQNKNIEEMLRTLGLFCSLAGLSEVLSSTSQCCSSEDIRLAYRKVIRMIHPDKLVNASVIQRLEAQELFAVITQAFNLYKIENNL